MKGGILLSSEQEFLEQGAQDLLRPQVVFLLLPIFAQTTPIVDSLSMESNDLWTKLLLHHFVDL